MNVKTKNGITKDCVNLEKNVLLFAHFFHYGEIEIVDFKFHDISFIIYLFIAKKMSARLFKGSALAALLRICFLKILNYDLSCPLLCRKSQFFYFPGWT